MQASGFVLCLATFENETKEAFIIREQPIGHAIIILFNLIPMIITMWWCKFLKWVKAAVTSNVGHYNSV
jgi:hypothetical protein